MVLGAALGQHVLCYSTCISLMSSLSVCQIVAPFTSYLDISCRMQRAVTICSLYDKLSPKEVRRQRPDFLECIEMLRNPQLALPDAHLACPDNTYHCLVRVSHVLQHLALIASELFVSPRGQWLVDAMVRPDRPCSSSSLCKSRGRRDCCTSHSYQCRPLLMPPP